MPESRSLFLFSEGELQVAAVTGARVVGLLYPRHSTYTQALQEAGSTEESSVKVLANLNGLTNDVSRRGLSL